MLHRLSENIADYFFDENDKYPKEVYKYGIELTISSVLGTLMIIITGIISGYVIEAFIFMIILSSIRFFTGGYHANTYLMCNAITLIAIIFSLISYLLIKSMLSSAVLVSVMLTVMLSLVITIIWLCPIENKNKLIPQEDRLKFKIISLVMVLIITFVCIFLYVQIDFEQVLIMIPTMIVVNISILAEIKNNKKRGVRNEFKNKHEESC